MLAGIEGLSAKDRIQFADDRRKLQNDVRTALLQAVAGAAVVIGVVFTWQQQQFSLAQQEQSNLELALQRHTQLAERFGRALGEIGDNNLNSRLAGLYELEQLARLEPERRMVTTELIAAYIRERGGPVNAESPIRLPPQDVTTALTILGRRQITNGDPPVDLHMTNLDRVYLANMVLGGADLSISSLRRAVLDSASLANATLVGTDLRGASLNGTDLRHARLNEADLRGANLEGAILEGANLGDSTANETTRWPAGFDWRRAGVAMS